MATPGSHSGASSSSRRYRYTKVLDNRKHSIRGLWRRNGKFVARLTVEDAAAADTNRTGLSDSAMDRVVHNEQLYDLWLGKSFQIGDVNGRIRAGNQVINWGESLFLFGGINATNAIDYQKSLIPGTQIKEYVLPAPLVSVAANILPGVNVEGYYQLMYNKNIYPPVGSYWSMADIFGPGARDPITFNPNNFNWYGLDPAAQQRLKTGGQFAVPGLGDKYPGGGGQYGLSMHYKPAGSVFDWGVYYLRYNDKAPVLNLVTDPTAPIGLDYQFTYRSERSLYGISTNFPVGDWAIGSEFSYRPRDAISLGSCFTPGVPLDSNVNVNPIPSQNCPLWADKDRQDLHVTALLQLSPSDYPFILHNLRADTGFLSLEVAGTRYGGINKNGITRTIEGVQVTQLPAAGYVNWLSSTDLSNPNAVPRGVGSEYSAGAVADFNWTYDSTVIPGWQVTPGITYFNAFLGNTPNFAASYLQGAQSVNLYVLFNQNPAVWQAGLNYTAFFGGQEASKQPYSDRSFVGGFVSFNF